MSEAYIIDAIRTPRGKGKKDGSLYEVKPITLLTTLLNELQQRHQLDTSKVDDIVLGCVTPIGDQGGDIAKTAAIAAGWNDDVADLNNTRYGKDRNHHKYRYRFNYRNCKNIFI